MQVHHKLHSNLVDKIGHFEKLARATQNFSAGHGLDTPDLNDL